jgi:hypothetical protein
VAAPPPGTPGQDPVVTVSGQNLPTCTYVALQVRNSAGLRSPLAEVVDGPASCAPVPGGPGITPQNPTASAPGGAPAAPGTTVAPGGGLPNTAAAGSGEWVLLGLVAAVIWLRPRRRRA